jgi:hypothetical protein
LVGHFAAKFIPLVRCNNEIVSIRVKSHIDRDPPFPFAVCRHPNLLDFGTLMFSTQSLNGLDESDKKKGLVLLCTVNSTPPPLLNSVYSSVVVPTA